MITPPRRRSFQRRLLAWYAINGRALPWRTTRDPYAILVCEILSHQTQISRVVPVYEELLRRYPSIERMASAPLDEVTAITDPLGYKIRGRWLHAAALQVRDAGGFPTTIEGLRQLPGVGRYTAGAIMSFAYRQDSAVVDTNIGRVLARHFEARTKSAGGASRLWQVAAEIVPKGKGYLLSQALMDLGATVCNSRAPRCPRCPLRRSCRFRHNEQR